MIIIVEHDSLINNHKCDNKTVTTYHWIYNMFKYLIDKHEFKQIEKDDIYNNVHNLDNYFLKNFNVIPSFIILFNKFELVSKIYKKKCSSNIIVIIDDIHHSQRIKTIQNKAFKNCKYILSTYSYVFNEYFGYSNNKIVNFNHSGAYDIEYNESPLNKILLVGHVNSSLYPDRAKFYDLSRTNSNIVVIHPPKYIQSENRGFVGYEFAKLINNYVCTFCDDSVRKYIVSKFFEIPCYGSLLLACNEQTKNEFEKLGFVDNINYISCNNTNWDDKINFILDDKNRTIVNQIRLRGYLLATSKHSYYNRANVIVDLVKK